MLAIAEASKTPSSQPGSILIGYNIKNQLYNLKNNDFCPYCLGLMSQGLLLLATKSMLIDYLAHPLLEEQLF